MEKLAKQLNEELVGLEFEDWIELDNYMVKEGFASTDNCNWDDLLDDGNVVYQFSAFVGEPGVQVFFETVEERGLKVTSVEEFY